MLGHSRLNEGLTPLAQSQVRLNSQGLRITAVNGLFTEKFDRDARVSGCTARRSSSQNR
jgi:hypothetical protein